MAGLHHDHNVARIGEICMIHDEDESCACEHSQIARSNTVRMCFEPIDILYGNFMTMARLLIAQLEQLKQGHACPMGVIDGIARVSTMRNP